jgi:hypothetical protein
MSLVFIVSLTTRAASVLAQNSGVSYNKKNNKYVYNFFHYPLLIP